MSGETPVDRVPEALVRKRAGIQLVWTIPLIAALVGGWLWFRAVQSRGPTIAIAFETAAGLEAGKTKLKYKELEIGKVTDIDLEQGLERVIVTAELSAGTEPYLVENTRFWVVRPRIGAGGVSGLGTIVSGSYIAADLSSSGPLTEVFTGLEEPPVRPAEAKGLRIRLRAETLGSISAGTPVSHLEICMGDVEGYSFLREEELIEFNVYIEPQYADLVRKNTRFWNASGLDVSLGADGFDVHFGSLEAMLTGGIEFGPAHGEALGAPAESGDLFELIPEEKEARKLRFDPHHAVAYFHEPVRGLSVGASVEFLGIEIGKVLSVGIEQDEDTRAFRMPVVIETYPQRLDFRSDEETLEESDAEQIERLVQLGMRAQLGIPNLLTGARDILVEFHPETPVILAHGDLDLPELPTIPSTGEALSDMVVQLPGIVADLGETVSGLSQLVNSSDTRELLASLNSATASIDKVLIDLSAADGPLIGTLDEVRSLAGDLDVLVAELQTDMPQLVRTLQETADAALALARDGERGVGSLADGMPGLQLELSAALTEIASAMRSIDALADYLERHPESLLKGKSSGGQ